MPEPYDYDAVQIDRLLFAREVTLDIADLNLKDERHYIETSPRIFRRKANQAIAECDRIHIRLLLDVDAIDMALAKIERMMGYE